MLRKKKLLLFICFAVFCLSSAPVSADLFQFTVHRLDMTYDGTKFDASLSAAEGAMALTRDVSPISTAVFGSGSGNFNIWTNISNFTGTGTALDPFRADGVGEFTLTDVDGDTITGDVAGMWIMAGVPVFVGNLSNVNWTQNGGDIDNLFDGDGTTEASMLFGASPPWSGTIIELTSSKAPWFGGGAWTGTVTGGSVDALVVPVPAAILLGVFGLSVVGVTLRKYA